MLNVNSSFSSDREIETSRTNIMYAKNQIKRRLPVVYTLISVRIPNIKTRSDIKIAAKKNYID
ncbi:hypothetical protein TCEA9_21200 [Thermobrachium celere]|nr:hypothetical protein TCEA9_21200 [Thermobrachium celere]